VFEWLGRLARRNRRFEVILLDPPTFSRSKEGRIFRAEVDYPRLLSLAMPVLARDGMLLACTNAAGMRPENFLEQIHQAIARSGRRVAVGHYVPQPPDFPITRAEPAHFKSIWLRVGGEPHAAAVT
jgi:23S rRNA (cytosine1962-C5)-methyltransferase